jgi:glutaredoxin-related protein
MLMAMNRVRRQQLRHPQSDYDRWDGSPQEFWEAVDGSRRGFIGDNEILREVLRMARLARERGLK